MTRSRTFRYSAKHVRVLPLASAAIGAVRAIPKRDATTPLRLRRTATSRRARRTCRSPVLMRHGRMEEGRKKMNAWAGNVITTQIGKVHHGDRKARDQTTVPAGKV